MDETTSENELDLYYYRYGYESIQELKQWIDDQIKAGKTKVALRIDFSEPSAIEKIKLFAKK